MKNKSSHHQSQNTFKYQTFSERLSTVNIDIICKFGKFTATPEDADTFFAEALSRWSEINLTQHFADFRKEISKEVQSLPQLVHHQNEIVAALEKHLRIRDSLALQPLLDLLVQLARDLQGDFYPFFEQFFHTLVWLLNTYHHNVDILEQTFTCLAYLFKFLWRHMLRDINNVFRLFHPLLGSQYKDYIHTFAAESFAFLMRKHKNHSVLFDFLFDSLDSDDKLAEGVGQLLFEMVKGVKHRFHSSLEQVLPILFSKLGQKKSVQDQIHKTMVAMFHAIATHTEPEYCQSLWGLLLQAVTDVHSSLTSSRNKQKGIKVKHINSLLTLIHVMVSRRQGRLVCCQDQLVQLLCELLQSAWLEESSAALLLKIISSLILAPRCQLAAHHRPHIVDLIYKSDLPNQLVFDFTTSLFDASLFEKDLLPGLLEYCHRCLKSSDSQVVLVVLTKLVQHKIPPTVGVIDPNDMKEYIMDMSIRSEELSVSFPSWLLKQIKLHSSPKTDVNLPELWALLTCLPNVRPLDNQESVSVLIRLFKCLNKHLTNGSIVPNEADECLHVLQQTVRVCYQLHENKSEFFKQQKLQQVLPLLQTYPQNVNCLKMCDFYITAAKCHCSHILTQDVFSELFKNLQYNFTSPFSQVRLLSAHILSQFELEMPPVPEDSNIEQMGLFKICFEAEKVPLTVQTYREKLRLLHKLSYDVVSCQIPVGPFDEVPLRYLCGMLYVNMTLMWKPVMELIASYAMGLSRQQFWSVWAEILQTAADNAEKERHWKQEEDTTVSNSTASDIRELFQLHLHEISTKSDRPDFINFRDHLWKAMQLFPDICEPKSRILSPLLFRFLENEYYPSDMNLAPTQDISIKRDLTVEEMDVSQDADQSQSLTEPEDMNTSQSEPALHNTSDKLPQEDTSSEDLAHPSRERENTENSLTTSPNPQKKRPRRATNKTLADHLTLYSMFKDPKSLYLESKLKELYYQLLEHKDANLQKIAFNCIMTYKYSYLTPYRENFDRLMDDKTFKNEIVLFSIDEAITVVKEEHRKDLLVVLLRILYGKMQSKAGKDTSGKGYSQYRKSIILRFLGGSKQEEVNMFLDMIFEPFRDYLTGSLQAKVKQVMEEADPTHVIPLRKLQGVLNTIDLVMHKLGSLLDGYLPRMVQLVTCIGGLCTGLLAQREQIHPKAVSVVKNIRNAVIVRICQFYDRYDYYEFSSEETEVFFYVAVWPLLEKLPDHSVSGPPPLLKLFKCWSENARFFPLFAKVHTDKTHLTPLSYIFQLLHAKHISPSVLTMVTDIIQNLLDAGNRDENMQDQQEDECPYGIQLLLPYVTTILLHLKTVVQRLANGVNKKKLMPVKELSILSRLSEYVTDSSESTEIVQLLLPLLGRSITRTEQVEIDILTIVNHLIQQTKRPQYFLVPLAKLFSVISDRNSREKLCAVLQTIAEKVPETSRLSVIVQKINSWDKKRLEEPDYLLRLEGFDEAQRLLEQSPELTVMLTLLHNCCFFITTTADMSLRDTSAFCIQKLIEKLSTFPADGELFRQVVLNNLIPEIKDKLKHKQEVVRNEFINILASLTRHFPSSPAFLDLKYLIEKDDIEVDFFCNIVHIQQHRRARALRRLVRILSTVKFSSTTLMAYMLPMATMFIKDDTYAKAINLHDAAVEATGAICRQLPWQHYVTVLRYFIAYMSRSVENKKLAVRLIVAVLDAYHFDLRNSAGVKTAQLVSNKDKEDKENTAVDSDVADPEAILNASEEQQLKIEDQEAEQIIPGDGEVAEVMADDDTSDEDVTSQGLPGTTQICPVGLATRIDKCISVIIIPKLYKALTQKAKGDDDHKKAHKKFYSEDEEILRVPLALAMVKLLQHLPAGRLEANLPSILIKVCQFLKSRSRDIRESARDTINKILQSLGSKYFYFIVKELRGTLKRGYQMHVLCYTVWSLMKSLTESGLSTGDLDHCVPMLVEIFNEELFGEMAEEKEVGAITSKLYEAKSSKSYDSYGIMAKFVSKHSLASLVKPLVQILEASNSHKKAKKVSDALHKISLGLVENTGLELSDLMTFIFALTTETLPQLKPKEKAQKTCVEKPGARPPSTYLLESEPKRGGAKPQTTSKTNMYLIVEFGLQVLHNLLKKSVLMPKEERHVELLDPFVSQITSCLSSKYMKVTTISLRCLLWLFKFPLPSLKDHIETITNHLFVLLSNYAAPGAAQGENLEMIMICFKAVTVLVRDVHYHTISTNQLQVLLTYAEQDIHDFNRHATAFSLFKAILSRKLVCPEMQEVMKKIEQLSIISETPHVRLQCRQVVMQYLLDYPLGKRLQRHLQFYISQLEYDHEAGRQSALEMLARIFSEFPQAIIAKYSGLFFVPLASRLVSDESTKCQELTSLAIKTLLSKLDSSERDHLFSMCTEWFKSSDAPVRKLAAKACGIFVDVESSAFERHLEVLLQLLEEEIEPEKYPDETYSEVDDRYNDRHLFIMLNLIMKLCRQCDLFRNSSWRPTVNKMWAHIESHLVYPHSWVRLCSAQLFGLLFSSWTPSELVTAAMKLTKQIPAAETKRKKLDSKEEDIPEYLLDNFHAKLYSLCGAFCKLLASPTLEQELADQVIKNLVFMSKVLRLLPENEQCEDRYGIKHEEGHSDNVDTNKKASFIWLLRRMCREARMEASLNPKHTVKRKSVFKWLAAVSLDLGEDGIQPYLKTILQPLIREVTDTSTVADDSLKQLSQEILDLIKSVAGLQNFTKQYATVQRSLAEKRETRKRQRAMEVVTNPELAARRKIRKHITKKETRKRRLEEFKPFKKLKRSKLER